MSLDETAVLVWQTKRPPLAMLVAGGLTEMLAGGLPPADQAPFLALSGALQSWWPNRRSDPGQLHDNEYQACLDAFAAYGPASKMQPALRGADMQMAALLMVAPRSLPAGGFHDLGEDDFVKLLRDGAKAAKLPVAQLEARLKLLIEHRMLRWPDLVVRSGRMRWGGQAPWGKLSKRVRPLASLADLGALVSWTDVGGQRALRLELDGTKRIAMLDPDELAALMAVIPQLAPVAQNAEN